MRNAEWIERLSRREVVARDRTCPSILNSAFRIPHLLYLPIREQHSAAWMGLGVALVGHPEVGPADAIAAGHEPAERVVEAGLASHGHPPDAGAGRGGFGRRDRGIERARVPGRELEHAHFVLRPTLGERRRVRSEERRVGKECRSRWSPYH